MVGAEDLVMDICTAQPVLHVKACEEIVDTPPGVPLTGSETV